MEIEKEKGGNVKWKWISNNNFSLALKGKGARNNANRN